MFERLVMYAHMYQRAHADRNSLSSTLAQTVIRGRQDAPLSMFGYLVTHVHKSKCRSKVAEQHPCPDRYGYASHQAEPLAYVVRVITVQVMQHKITSCLITITTYCTDYVMQHRLHHVPQIETSRTPQATSCTAVEPRTYLPDIQAVRLSGHRGSGLDDTCT